MIEIGKKLEMGSQKLIKIEIGSWNNCNGWLASFEKLNRTLEWVVKKFKWDGVVKQIKKKCNEKENMCSQRIETDSETHLKMKWVVTKSEMGTCKIEKLMRLVGKLKWVVQKLKKIEMGS